MRIGFLTNAYPFDKQSQISSFYQWVKEKQQEVIVIACFSDSYVYDKKSNVLSLPFKNLNDVMELGEFHFDLLQATFDDPLINLCKTQLKLPVFEKEILQCNFNDVFKKYQDALESYCICSVDLQKKYVKLVIQLNPTLSKEIKITLDDYVQYGLRKGIAITKEQLHSFEEHIDSEQLYQRCLRKLSLKDRTIYEMRKWLKETELVEYQEVNALIDKLIQKGYLDDEKLCMEQIQALSNSLYGPKQIISKLKQRGVKEDCILACMEQSKLKEYEFALAYATKALRQSQKSSVTKTKNTIRNKLMTRGYSNNTIEKVVSELDYSSNKENEDVLLEKLVKKAMKRYERKYRGYDLKTRIYRYCLTQGFHSEDINAVMDRMEWSHDED
ncbi:RecX family transcriptional regulator [Solobacterium moorei]|uniref:Regulatory protein RecX n=1 Tax=Solobacterium moorei F0204 TaxID=706433 RepID=E7MPP5_9FIRM|nr:RecX family transcriptional regulator [Solobacterium moorei]EFW23977.1 regulatory protein RecX [Solobacterium moorei F0204]